MLFLSYCMLRILKLKHWDRLQVRKSDQFHRAFLLFYSHMIISLSCPLTLRSTLLTQAKQDSGSGSQTPFSLGS